MSFMNKNDLKETLATHKIGKLQMNIYESQYGVPYHWHDEYEFICVTNGMLECIVNGVHYKISKGQAILIRGGELHSVNSDFNTSFFAVVFHPYTIFGTECRDFFSKKIKFLRIFNSSNHSEKTVIENLEILHFSFLQKKYAFELKLKALIINIFSIIFENHLYSEKELKTTVNQDNFASIIEYIHSAYNKKITLNDICNYANYSRSHIINLFKTNTGKTPFEYINFYKIYKAKELLTSSSKSILEVCFECGFENLSYFIRLFKQSTGMSPLQYRKNQQNYN